jgi:predicted nucleic acid-binding Zn ribbon protein
VSPYRNGPRPLAPAIEGIRADLAPRTLLADVQQAWPEAVGPAVAAEASPTAERGGVLTVSCSASVWAQELDLMSEAILERLNGHLRSGRIVRLRCVATPPFRTSI